MATINQQTPDYQQYSIKELEDVLAHVDQAAYPERYSAAKAMLEYKLAAGPTTLENTIEEEPEPVWSERHRLTRLLFVLSALLSCAYILAGWQNFIPTHSWVAQSKFLKIALASALLLLWVSCLFYDEKLSRRLQKRWQGAVVYLFMPIFLIVISVVFIEKTLGLTLHLLTSPKSESYVLAYQKQEGRKYCRRRLALIATDTFEQGELCLRISEIQQLPPAGNITVLASQSRFGFHIRRIKVP